MTTATYLAAKNALVLAVTGLILIPEDQIVDIKPAKLDVCLDQGLNDFDMLSSETCPYCAEYSYGSFLSCDDCPMALAGNECAGTAGIDTWSKANSAWQERSTEKDWQALKDLAMEYNKQFKENADDTGTED